MGKLNIILHLFKISIWLKDYNLTQSVKMQNEAGEYVDLYIPRKCSASNRIIGAGDHASVQINIAEVDEKTGRMTGITRLTPSAARSAEWAKATIASSASPRRTAFFHPTSEKNDDHLARQEGRHSSIEHLRRMMTIWPPTILFQL